MICFVIGTTAEVVKIAPVAQLLTLRGYDFQILLTGQQGSETWKAISYFGLRQKTESVLDTQEGISSIFSAMKWFGRILFKCVFRNKLRMPVQLTKSKTVLVVHGDTLSTLLGSLIAKRCGFPLVHIEAGLRSGDFFNPFPEEIIRVLVSNMSSINYAPSEIAKQNLKNAPGVVVFTHGNTCIDTLLLGEKETTVAHSGPEYAVVLLHRTEFLRNKDIFQQTILELKQVSARLNLMVVTDPIAKLQMKEVFDSDKQVTLLDKMDYFDFQKLVKDARFVITDSGGLQEECASLGMPCLIHRKATEREDGLKDNAKLSNWAPGEILLFAESFSRYTRPPTKRLISPSEIIVNDLLGRGWA